MSAGSSSDELTPACQEFVDGFNASADGCTQRAGLCLHNLFDPSDISQLFAVGIVISLVSSAVTNLGANVQKLALNRELRRTHAPQRPMYRIPLCAECRSCRSWS